MKMRKKLGRSALAWVLLLVMSFCMTAFAASDDNSLSSLNIHNGRLSRDFQYNIWEYDVTVEPGTAELFLEPQTSDVNASVTSITGTVLEGGKATVLINTVSESGVPMTYTLHVKESGEAPQTEAPQTEAPETESAAETASETAVQTEATETEAPVATNALQNQVAKLKSDTDLMLKIVYGLIALCVILLFLIINLILKNRDLKDDLKDAEDQLAYQTNEFARKERMMATDTYYAPVRQDSQPGGVQPDRASAYEARPVQASAPMQQNAPVVEETFGTGASVRGYKGMQPEDVPPNLPITEEALPPEPKQEEFQPELPVPDMAQANAEESGSDVDITMVEL